MYELVPHPPEPLPEGVDFDAGVDEPPPLSDGGPSRTTHKVAGVLGAMLACGVLIALWATHSSGRMPVREEQLRGVPSKVSVSEETRPNAVGPCQTTVGPCATTVGPCGTSVPSAPTTPAVSPSSTTAGEATKAPAQAEVKTLLDADSSGVLKQVLAEATKIESQAMGPKTSDRVMKDVDSATSPSEQTAILADSKNHDALVSAINEYSEQTSPEQAAEKGALITGTTLRELAGLSLSPEKEPPPSLKCTFRDDVCVDDDGVGQMPSSANKTGRRLAAKLGWPGRVWKNRARIPYCFSSSTPASVKTAFQAAVEQYENLVPCLKFAWVNPRSDSEEQCREPGMFVKSFYSGCWAYVSWKRSTYTAVVNLQPNWCDTVGTAVHEIGHAIGMAHEQVRPDAWRHVTVLWHNIQPGQETNFRTDEGADTSIPYDIMSVMHYTEDMFPKRPGLKTLIPRAGNKVMGNRMGLTQSDALQVAKTYGCRQASFEVCTNDPDKCSYGDCICHQDASSKYPIIKTSVGSCKRCQYKCSLSSGLGMPEPCGCPDGSTKALLGRENGKDYWTCKASPSPPAGSNKLSGAAPGSGNTCYGYYGDTWCYLVKNDGTYARQPPDNCGRWNNHDPKDWCWKSSNLRKAQAGSTGYCYAYYGDENDEAWCYLKRSSGAYAKKNDIDCASYNRHASGSWCYDS